MAAVMVAAARALARAAVATVAGLAVAEREVERVGKATSEGSEVAARAAMKVEALRQEGRVEAARALDYRVGTNVTHREVAPIHFSHFCAQAATEATSSALTAAVRAIGDELAVVT
jgi:hypothetical protein